jgi:hypothetical protein
MLVSLTEGTRSLQIAVNSTTHVPRHEPPQPNNSGYSPVGI